jgi:hypothetical protein
MIRSSDRLQVTVSIDLYQSAQLNLLGVINLNKAAFNLHVYGSLSIRARKRRILGDWRLGNRSSDSIGWIGRCRRD